jgi:drug/metabolite transporter (DMT)-like permease
MSLIQTWCGIGAIVVTATVGDVFLARGMSAIGDVGELFANRGLISVVKTVLANTNFLLGVAGMTFSFFSLLITLSWADVSLVAPASASLTFISNALTAKFFLKENVDRRRWAAALFVCAGVVLLTF